MLIAMSVAMLLLLAVIGMAFDMGRIYIARNEARLRSVEEGCHPTLRLAGE